MATPIPESEPRKPNEPAPQRPYENDEYPVPREPEREMNPGEIGTDTEIDLDPQKTPTYPKTEPPEEH